MDTNNQIQEKHQIQYKPGVDTSQIKPVLEEWIIEILYGEKLSENYAADWTEEARKGFITFCEAALNSLADQDRDRFIDRIENLITPSTKQNIWELEHEGICNGITALVKRFHRLPGRLELAKHLGLSYDRVNNHLAAYPDSEQMQRIQENVVVMRERIISRCYQLAVDGDMKAARLFLEATANQRPSTSIKNQQNNFIQINGTTITEDQVKQLPEDQQVKLMELLAAINSPTAITLPVNKG